MSSKCSFTQQISARQRLAGGAAKELARGKTDSLTQEMPD